MTVQRAVPQFESDEMLPLEFPERTEPALTEATAELHTCGWPEDSFACKIRHLQINTGAAKAGKITAGAGKQQNVEITPNGRVIR